KGGIPVDIAEYLTLIYTPDALYIQNRAADRWLPLVDVMIGGVDMTRTIYDENVLANLLAPGQCVIWAHNPTTNPDSQPGCDQIAGTGNFASAEMFWTREFDVRSRVDGSVRTCPPAVTGQIVMCLLPRLQDAE
ncbi:MAG TPA: hypothetical protein VHL11_10850, partial [Phototrophicaceae bacterium]|nr:hypothetical protein [Phototrophicaceae bacterium]